MDGGWNGHERPRECVPVAWQNGEEFAVRFHNVDVDPPEGECMRKYLDIVSQSFPEGARAHTHRHTDTEARTRAHSHGSTHACTHTHPPVHTPTSTHGSTHTARTRHARPATMLCTLNNNQDTPTVPGRWTHARDVHLRSCYTHTHPISTVSQSPCEQPRCCKYFAMAHTHTQIYAHGGTCMRTHACAHKHTPAHTHTHTHSHTHTRTHTHTQAARTRAPHAEPCCPMTRRRR